MCTNSESIDVEVVNCVGIEETEDATSLIVFPNPTNDLINIRLDNPDKDVRLKLVNMEGKEIRSQSAFTREANGLYQTEVRDLARGIYMLQIEIEGNYQYRKIVVQ